MGTKFLPFGISTFEMEIVLQIRNTYCESKMRLQELMISMNGLILYLRSPNYLNFNVTLT